MAKDLPELFGRLSRRLSERNREVVQVRILSKKGAGKALVSVTGCEAGEVLATEPTPIACGSNAQAVVNRTSGVVTILPGPKAAAGRAVVAPARVRGTELALAHLTVSVVVVNDDAGELAAEDFGVELDGEPVALGEVVVIAAGEHALTYTLPGGYTVSAWGGDVETDGTFAAVRGDDLAASITFDDEPQELTVSDVVCCDAFASSGGPSDGAGCQHLVTAGQAPATFTFHRWEAYVGGAVEQGDTIRATVVSPAGVVFGSGGGPSASVDVTAAVLNSPWPSGNQRCSQANISGATHAIKGDFGGEFLGIPTGAAQGVKIRLRFENVTNPTTSPEIESLTISGTGIPDCSA